MARHGGIAARAKARRCTADTVFARFRSVRRGWFSFIALGALYALSLAAEFVSNDRPLWLRFGGRSYFPVLRAYSHGDFTEGGGATRVSDYRAFLATHADEAGRVLMAPFESGPHQVFSADDIRPFLRCEVALTPDARAVAYQIGFGGAIAYAYGDTNRFGLEAEDFARLLDGGGGFAQALARRRANLSAPAFEMPAGRGALWLAPFSPRKNPPDGVRVFMRETSAFKPARADVPEDGIAGLLRGWGGVSEADVSNVLAAVEAPGGDGGAAVAVAGGAAIVTVARERPAWPFRPVPGHPMGFDAAGRDVLARVLYALRVSVSFGLLLVAATLALGTIAGAVQGYFAGWTDIAGQRLTEVWSALPFLYVMILLGGTLGRGFGVLLLCYAAFNWIGVAAFVRAEFLRLRTRAFVDAARCQGLSGARVIFTHILPNALTPLVTLSPFALVGAVGSLAMLDYLGFGLPAGAPSWGDLLSQAQTYRNAWWLVLWPSLALFTVMLLGVFIGEAMRAAADPRPRSDMK